MPTVRTAKAPSNIWEMKFSGVGTYLIQTSIINPIIKAFKIVPIPGFCFKGNQSNKTIILIKIVMRPMEKPMFKYKPWANTLQGDAPDAETINKPSPKPNKVKPKQRKKNVEIFGFKFNGFSNLLRI